MRIKSSWYSKLKFKLLNFRHGIENQEYMHRLLKISVAAIIGGPLAALLLWYAFSFLLHLGELKSISARGNESIARMAPAFYPFAVAGETKQGLRSYAMRQAYRSLEYRQAQGRALSWHANNLLWLGASYPHFDEREIFGLWVECALSQCDGGLENIARKHFGKEATHFSERELAALVAMVRSPSRYAPGTVRGEQRTNLILDRAKFMATLPGQAMGSRYRLDLLTEH